MIIVSGDLKPNSPVLYDAGCIFMTPWHFLLSLFLFLPLADGLKGW